MNSNGTMRGGENSSPESLFAFVFLLVYICVCFWTCICLSMNTVQKMNVANQQLDCR